MTKKQLMINWRDQICKNKNVDPYSEYIWEGVFVGFAVANGFTPNKAREMYEDAYKYELENHQELDENNVVCKSKASCIQNNHT